MKVVKQNNGHPWAAVVILLLLPTDAEEAVMLLDA
jgi:hypothetical protein